MKKLIILFIVLSISILAISLVNAEEVGYNIISYNTLEEFQNETGIYIDEFKEAPQLKERVASGDLPPLEERLPVEPLVVEPYEEIGQYGGVIKTGASGPAWGGGDDWQLRAQFLLRLTSDLKTVVPNIAKDIEVSDDAKEITIYLREGMKWSDGHPFTTEDVEYWYQDVLLNSDLTPSIPTSLSTEGDPVQVEIIDDYTFTMSFSQPNRGFLHALALGVVEPYQPKHYLKQYHKTYNPDIVDIAEEQGYATWMDLYDRHNITNFGQQQIDPDCPTLYPWKLEEVDDNSNKYYVRNPYYFKIDTAGQQLPYADEQQRLIFGSAEVFGLQSIAGDYTAAGQFLSLSDMPLYSREQETGNYRVQLFEGAGNQSTLMFNYSYQQDDMLRDIFNDLRFRKAVSLAIDRDEINQQLMFGRGTPRPATIDPTASFHEDWMGNYYIERDLEKANQLLDEMGLVYNEREGYRMRPDGEDLRIDIFTSEGMQREVITELVADHLNDVGINAELNLIERSLLVERRNANELTAKVWQLQHVDEFSQYHVDERMTPASAESPARGWYNYFFTDSEGITPPEEAIQVVDLKNEWQTTEPGSDRYLKLGNEYVTIYTENLWQIGTVGLVPHPVIIDSDIVNAPYEGVWTFSFRRFLPYSGDQWFFKKMDIEK